MGWAPWRSPSVPRGTTAPDCWNTGDRRSPSLRMSGWQPSRDIADAWRVVESIEARGWKVVYRTNGVRTGPRVEIHVPHPEGAGEWLFTAEGESASAAICRAALAAVSG